MQHKLRTYLKVIAENNIKIDRRLEPIPYLPENFKENDPLVIEILKNGIEIK